MREDAVSVGKNDVASSSSPLNFSRIGVVGINFKTAPISVREHFARSITIDEVAKLGDPNVCEFVLLSTCNRVELYYYYETSSELSESVENVFRRTATGEQFKFYHHRGVSAVTHLFEVAGGLDSLVVGETQILSQVREAAKQSGKVCGPVLSKMFAKAYDCGRRLREENPNFTNGMKNSVSLSVLRFISNSFSQKSKPNILLVGSGKMIRLALALIDRRELGRVDVAARRRILNGIEADSVVPISDIGQTILDHKVDVVITATSADRFILSAQDLATGLTKELLILDISVPRNVDPKVGNLPGVTLLNLDDLKDSMADVQDLPTFAKLRSFISVRVGDFVNWLREYDEVAPVLGLLRKRAELIRAEEFENALSRMPDLAPSQRAVIEKMTERLTRRFLHEPTAKLKQMTRGQDAAKTRQYAEVLRELFSSSEENEEEGEEEKASSSALLIQEVET